MENQKEDYMGNQMGNYMKNHTAHWCYEESETCETRQSGQTRAQVLVHYYIMFVLIHGIPFHSIPFHVPCFTRNPTCMSWDNINQQHPSGRCYNMYIPLYHSTLVQ